jgi:hypothetical protein
VHSNPLRILASAVVVCCLAIGGAGGTAIDPARATSIEASTEAESRSPDESTLQQLQRANASAVETDLRIDIHANGSAVWTVHYRFRLADTNETAAFDRLRADIRANPDRYRDRFSQRMTGAVASAENATGRGMNATNVSVRAAPNGTTGVVTYEFVWRNFAATDGDRLRIDGALAGFALNDRTQVTMSWPDDYEAATVRPTPTERRPNAITWTGATAFTGSEPVVELLRTDSTTDTTGSGAAGGADGEPASGSDLPLPGIGMVALVLLVGSLGVVWFARRRQTDDTAASATPGADTSETSREPSIETAPTSSDGGSQNPPTESTDDRPSLDLLSNEERVVEVLRRSGGRAKQQQVVDQLGWTDAKTSSVVSQLRDDGTIEGFRLGRENVLRLPDDDHENETDADDTPNDE